MVYRGRRMLVIHGLRSFTSVVVVCFHLQVKAPSRKPAVVCELRLGRSPAAQQQQHANLHVYFGKPVEF